MTSAPQHCAHECVCGYFHKESAVAHCDGTPCMRNHNGCKSCVFDTRKSDVEPMRGDRWKQFADSMFKPPAAIAEHEGEHIIPPDCFNDVNDDGSCEHATKGERGETKSICSIVGNCRHQEVVDCRPSYYQTYCNVSEHDARVRKGVLKEFDGFIDAYSRQDEDGHDYVLVLALQNHIDCLRDKK